MERISELINELRTAKVNGYKWGAYELPQNGTSEQPILSYFESSLEAEAFCNTDDFNRMYAYNAIDNLIQSLSPIPFKNSLTPTSSLNDLCTKHGLKVDTYALEQLQSGAFWPVRWQAEIIPEKVIDMYHVVSHYHPGHQVYEIGHEVGIAGSFMGLDTAKNKFKELLEQYHQDKDTKHDCLLIGQLKGIDLKLDMDGNPDLNSGITIFYGYIRYDATEKQRIIEVAQVHDLCKKMILTQDAIARYYPNNNNLSFYDQQLREIQPQLGNSLFHPYHFDTYNSFIKNYKIMNEKNIETLQKQVKFTGFGEELKFQIEDKVKQGQDSFQLLYSQEFGNDRLKAVLNFHKSKQDNYFFNTYDITVDKQNGEAMKQMFHVNKPIQAIIKTDGGEDKTEWVNNTITLKEAYNMMEGRSVLKNNVTKEREKYSNWVSLDFKNTDDDGNYLLKKHSEFDMESKLAALPIKELSDPQKKKELIESLEKGNRQSVTMLRDGGEQRFMLVAVPAFKKVDFYDGSVRQSIGQSQAKTEKQSEKEGQKQGDEPEAGEITQKNKRHGITN